MKLSIFNEIINIKNKWLKLNVFLPIIKNPYIFIFTSPRVIDLEIKDGL
jgi:hypothetical protein